MFFNYVFLKKSEEKEDKLKDVQIEEVDQKIETENSSEKINVSLIFFVHFLKEETQKEEIKEEKENT